MARSNKRRLVMVERSYDKCCFGKYRAVTTLTHKEYTIRKGSVFVRFRNQWYEADEGYQGRHEEHNNYMQARYDDFPPKVELIFH